MDAIDRERTRKAPQVSPFTQTAQAPRTTQVSGPTRKQPTISDRSTALVTRVGPTSGRLPATRPADGAEAESDDTVMVIAPRRIVAPTTPTRAPRSGRPVLSTTMRFVVGVVCIAAVLAVALGYNVLHSSTTGADVAGAVPPPSGRGPITASVGVIVAAPAPQSVHTTGTVSPYQAQVVTTSSGGSVAAKGLLGLEPCRDSYIFVPNINQWTVPPGCYANIYVPNRANYVQAASWGYCNWWVEVTHPNAPNITYGNYARGTTPVAGAAIFFDGGEQGADPAGHWAEAVAVSPDHYWVLISEMNFAWRGGGFGRIDYRYIHVSPHVHFLYGV
ncbi:MAG: hypothetical protein ACRDID_14825 [Ktedonobacterales bacterium]